MEHRKNKSEFYAKHKGRKDYVLICLIILLLIFGLIMLFSTSSYNGYLKFGDSGYYLKKQIFASTLGIVVMYIFSGIEYSVWKNTAGMIYIVSLLLSTFVLFIGASYNGSKRWIMLGPLSFQPSEFAKVAVILFMAYRIEREGKNINRLSVILKNLLLLVPIVGLVGMNNLSTAIIILGIGCILIFSASPKYTPFILIGLLGVILIVLFLSMESYRLERLQVWRNPELYDKGYQTMQGLYAIGSGGFFGKGLGNSIQKLGFVPEAQNDMIFSIICEELGLFGALVLLILFLLLIWRFMVIAMHARDLFALLITVGVMAHISLQVILNVAVVTNTIPNTGITLPFVSYGGTSILFLLAEMGIVLNISAQTML